MSIVNNVRDAFTRVIEGVTGAAYVIRDALFGAPETVPKETVPFIPPFTGGQCEGATYRVTATITKNFPSQSPIFSGTIVRQATVTGRITEISTTNSPSTGTAAFIRHTNGTVRTDLDANSYLGEGTITIDSISITREGGSDDDCGNLPNPNPPPPISDSGLADSIPPDIVGDGITISEGLAPLPAAGALAAALAALRSALEIAALAEALADAIKALKDALDNKDDKDDKKNKKVIQLDLGLIQADGFLRLYPSSNSQNYQALYLDLQVQNIPRGLGRFFGQRSPNYFRFKELGYISWVSPTFGVISVESIRFSRVSLGCPEGAIGFFYHLGLDGIIKANATAFYEEEVEDESE